MSYVTFVHGCAFPVAALSAADNPGVGSVWRCDVCGTEFVLVGVKISTANPSENLLSWLQLPRVKELSR